jgi:AcrR family transcriptional regulator
MYVKHRATHVKRQDEQRVRRTADEAEQTREAILAAAHDLFATHGFAATSTAAVVEAAGVTRGALYHHFAHKTALFRAVFVRLEHDMNDTVTRVARSEATSFDAFVAGCGALLDFMVRPDYQQIAVVDAPAVLGSAEWHGIDAGIGLASLQYGLTALDRDGYLRLPASPALAVALFGALTEAGIVLSRGAEGSPSRDELLDAVIALVSDNATRVSRPRSPGRRGR